MDLQRLIEERRGVLLVRELRAAGVCPHQEEKAWRRVNRLVVVHESAPDDRITDILVAAVTRPAAIITGTSAALLRPDPVWSGLPLQRYPPILIGDRGRRGPPRIVTHANAGFTESCGIRIADPITSLVDLLRFLPWPDAAAVAGRARQSGRYSVAALRHRAQDLRCQIGAGQLRTLVRAMEMGAESGPEIDLHLALHRAGLRGWLANQWLEIRGERLRPDIVFPVQRVAIEYDGEAAHAGTEAFHTDRRRLCLLAFEGWVTLPITKRVLDDPAALAAFLNDLRGLLASRGR